MEARAASEEEEEEEETKEDGEAEEEEKEEERHFCQKSKDPHLAGGEKNMLWKDCHGEL